MNTEELDVNRYSEDGFIFPLRAMDPDAALQFRSEIEALEDAYRDNPPGRSLNQYFRVNAHHVLLIAVELASQKPVLDAVEKIIGPNILIWSCEFFIKEAGSEKIVSWHQDMTYWGLGEKEGGDTDQLVTAWIALSPATTISGCMKFVSGSHKQNLQPHKDSFAEENLLSRGQEIVVDVDEDAATHVVLQPGEFSLHHGRMFHASGPNTSDDRRIGVAIRYVTPEVKQLVGVRDYAMLARGVDELRNWINIAPPKSDFSENKLDLYEQVLGDQAAALSQGAEQDVGLYGDRRA